MEINATNEARSTENENATHDTWFRLSLDLHTPHDRGGSNHDSNLSFSGTTPEAFDHALATILDVVTSTVYGGQLNGLQEIIDHDVSELRASIEKAQDDAQQPKRNPALDVDTPKISTVTEPRPSFAPLSKPGAQGAKGLMLLHCPGCGRTFKSFSNNFVEATKCFCGAEVPLLDTARFEFTCKSCGKLTYGRTNIETATIDAGSMNCACGTPCRELRWDPEVRSFHD